MLAIIISLLSNTVFFFLSRARMKILIVVTNNYLHFACTCVGSKFVSNDGSTSSKVSAFSAPPTPRTEGEILQSANLRSFSFSDLKLATRNFRPDSVLGEGGFGSVFKGWIDENSFTAAKPGTGIVLAVKRLNQESFQGHREWLVSSSVLKISSGLYLID